MGYGEQIDAWAMKAAGQDANCAVVLKRIHWHQIGRWPQPVEWVTIKRENLLDDLGGMSKRTFERSIAELVRLRLVETERKGVGRRAPKKLRLTPRGVAAMKGVWLAANGLTATPLTANLAANQAPLTANLAANQGGIYIEGNFKSFIEGTIPDAVPSSEIGDPESYKVTGGKKTGSKGNSFMVTVREMIAKSSFKKPLPGKLEKVSDLIAVWRAAHGEAYPKVFIKLFTMKDVAAFKRILKSAPDPQRLIETCVKAWPQFTMKVVNAGATKTQPQFPAIAYVEYHLAVAVEFTKAVVAHGAKPKVEKSSPVAGTNPVYAGFKKVADPEGDIATLDDILKPL